VIFENLRLRSLLLAGVLLCGAVVVRGQQTGETAASSTSSTQQSSGGSIAGPSAQSVPSALVPGMLPLSLQDAIDGGLKQNLGDQATDQVTAGTSPDIDALRAKVQLQTREQQLIQARNNFAIQKLVLARAIGLAPGQEFDLTDKSPYQPFPGITLDEALTRAYALRADYQAAMADVCAAEFARKAAGAGYLPSVVFNGKPAVGTHLS
jgi:hypothetical protein